MKVFLGCWFFGVLDFVFRFFGIFQRSLARTKTKSDFGNTETADFTGRLHMVCHGGGALHIHVYIYMSLHACIYRHIQKYTHIYTYMYTRAYVCMYVCMYVCTYIYIDIFIFRPMYTCIHICIYRDVYVHVCVHVHIYMCIVICICLCIYVHIHVYTYLYMYVYMYTRPGVDEVSFPTSLCGVFVFSLHSRRPPSAAVRRPPTPTPNTNQPAPDQPTRANQRNQRTPSSTFALEGRETVAGACSRGLWR